MSFLVVNIAAPWQLACSENIASLDFFPRLDIVLSGRAPDNRCLTEYIVAIGNSSVHRSSTPVESMDSPMNLTTQPLDQPMNLTTVWCKSDASMKSTGE